MNEADTDATILSQLAASDMIAKCGTWRSANGSKSAALSVMVLDRDVIVEGFGDTGIIVAALAITVLSAELPRPVIAGDVIESGDCAWRVLRPIKRSDGHQQVEVAKHG